MNPLLNSCCWQCLAPLGTLMDMAAQKFLVPANKLEYLLILAWGIAVGPNQVPARFVASRASPHSWRAVGPATRVRPRERDSVIVAIRVKRPEFWLLALARLNILVLSPCRVRARAQLLSLACEEGPGCSHVTGSRHMAVSPFQVNRRCPSRARPPSPAGPGRQQKSGCCNWLSVIDRIGLKRGTRKSVVKSIFHRASELLLLSLGNDTIDLTPKRNIW